jgi:hypothetical protein
MKKLKLASASFITVTLLNTASFIVSAEQSNSL